MKKHAKLLAVILSIALLTAFLAATLTACNDDDSNPQPKDKWEYTLLDGDEAYALVKYRGIPDASETVKVPDTYNGKPVTQIGNLAFERNTLGAVTLGNNVTRISWEAFSSCPNLTKVTLSASIEYIGSYAFADCPSLVNIYFGGTQSQWNNIQKGDGWNHNTGSYTVHCSNGNLMKG